MATALPLELKFPGKETYRIYINKIQQDATVCRYLQGGPNMTRTICV